jgi:NAD(P)-dependent dehydrogenase (short-subunit alcohol dehydrogenase family)
MNKIILVTGGNRGIGRAISIQLGSQGYFVCVNYKSDEKSATQVVKQINNGGKAIAIQADISIEKNVIDLFEKIDSLDGNLVGLVNNAGILGVQSRLTEMFSERIIKTFNTNVIGTILCSKEAIKRMSTRFQGQGGGIVNISSGSTKSGSPNEYLDYASAKGAIDIFTIGLAKELATEGIRVNAIRPGFIETEIHNIPNRLELVKERIPMKRVGQPSEIADVVVWLLSKNSSYTSGAIIDVAGAK